MKVYRVLTQIKVNGKRYKVGDEVELTDEQAKYGKGSIIEIPQAVLENAKGKKSKGKTDEETDDTNLENNL